MKEHIHTTIGSRIPILDEVKCLDEHISIFKHESDHSESITDGSVTGSYCGGGTSSGMPGGLEPTEEYDGSITVHVLRDKATTERVPCSSYQDAIETVKEENSSATATKIESRDGEIVFTSTEMDIEDWKGEWERAKRRLSVDVESYDCPYDNVGCVADDLCVRCKIDKAQDQF